MNIIHSDFLSIFSLSLQRCQREISYESINQTVFIKDLLGSQDCDSFFSRNKRSINCASFKQVQFYHTIIKCNVQSPELLCIMGWNKGNLSWTLRDLSDLQDHNYVFYRRKGKICKDKVVEVGMHFQGRGMG